jgi:hypothetical protein
MMPTSQRFKQSTSSHTNKKKRRKITDITQYFALREAQIIIWTSDQNPEPPETITTNMCSTTTSDIFKLDPDQPFPQNNTEESGTRSNPTGGTPSLARRAAAPAIGKLSAVSNKKDKKKLTAHVVAVSPRSTVAKKSKLSSLQQRGPRYTRSVLQPSWSQNTISSSSNSIIPLDMPAIQIHRKGRTLEEQDMKTTTFGWDDFPVLRRMMVPIQP